VDDDTHECVKSYGIFKDMQDEIRGDFKGKYSDTIENGFSDYGKYIKLGKKYYELYGI